MLSLLSLLLASGTVLRPDTQEWTACAYPDPRANFTDCNSWPNSTLCDPDHVLTEQWRLQINQNLNDLMDSKRMVKAQIVSELSKLTLEYTDWAPFQCYANSTQMQLYVLLAKRIQSAKNHTISETDLTRFGDGIVEKFGLKDLECKNFLIFIGVEAAKMAYVRTGSDLKLPSNLMEKIFSKHNLFKAKNFMEVLSKIITEIGEKISERTDEQVGAQNDTMSLMEEMLDSNVTAFPMANITMTDMLLVKEDNDRWLWLALCLTTTMSVVLLVMVCLGRKENRGLKRSNQSLQRALAPSKCESSNSLSTMGNNAWPKKMDQMVKSASDTCIIQK